MYHERNHRPATALERHSESDLVPHASGPANFAFGKEALLALYTDIRPRKQPVVDFIISEAKRRNSGVFTTSHVLAEVLGTVRSRKNAEAVAQLWDAVADSSTYVLHGARPWESPNRQTGEKAISRAVRNLYEAWTEVAFKFHEGTLVLDAAKLNDERESETTYVVSLDGSLTNLAWNENLNVLPSRTPHRSDAR